MMKGIFHLWNVTWRARTAGAVLVLSAALALLPARPAQAQVFMSKNQEKEIGSSEHPKILEEYGGVYDGFDLSAYVATIGGRVAANSDDPSIGYTVTLLNSPIVNAFALPGGYVYVTRGLVALANSEAELAGVLGHEIGHVTARHTAKRYDRAVGTSILGTIASIALGSSIAGDLIGMGGQLYLASFSRQQEYEADLIGVRVLARTGYDPFAQADFLNTMKMDSELEAKIAGAEASRAEFLATHPNTGDRVLRAIEEAKKSGLSVQAHPRLKNEYLAKIDGMTYGDDPKEGFVRGRTFQHSVLKFSFMVPEGFRLQNTSQAVAAQANDGSLMVFDGRKVRSGTGAARYLQGEFAQEVGARPRNIESLTIGGMAAATGTTSGRTSQGNADIRLVAIEYAPDMMYRFILVTPTNRTAQQAKPMRDAVMTFRRLSNAEAAKLKPLRVRIVTAKAGDSTQSLAQRMAYSDYRVERFRVLNGLDGNKGVTAGARYKIVAE